MNKPFLSVIVPIYNAEKYLYQCIDSILAQSFTDYELFLIDDGSSDSSIEIIKEYAAKDSRIKTAFIKGHGPSIPRNYGMRRATGEYITFIDSDDYLPTDAFKTLVETALKYPTASFIRGNQRILVNDTIEEKSVLAPPRVKYANRIVDGEEFMVKVLDKDYAPIDSLIKTSFLREHKIEFHEDLSILEDGPFIIEIMGNNPDCVYIEDETYVYRLGNPTSVTNSKKSFSKCKSLVLGSYYNSILMNKFSGIGRTHIKNRSVEHSVSAIFQAAMYSKYGEAKEILKDAMKIWPKMYPYGENKRHDQFIRLYNISPILALCILYALRPVIKRT